MDKEGRVVIGKDWDGTMRDSITEFREKKFLSKNLAVRAVAYLSFAFVDLFGMGANASNDIEKAHVNEGFREAIRINADDNVRTVCITRNNHKNQIRTLLEKEEVKDPAGMLDVIHSKEETPKGYSIDIFVDDSIIKELREGRKSENYIMWAGYGHNAAFGKLFRKLGFTNVAMNKDELISMSRDRVEDVRRKNRIVPPGATNQVREQKARISR